MEALSINAERIQVLKKVKLLNSPTSDWRKTNIGIKKLTSRQTSIDKNKYVSNPSFYCSSVAFILLIGVNHCGSCVQKTC